ncbi:complex I subunit 5 family protein [Fuchsiella alkaliacetigena]|uniref:complex I subunit 5 family protein n=1 Tax=Fuchsiella alkaliacetigena TaxID=957042 RepID=UPI002009E94D|nr:proton-conducting transporter membrane subunit [Fuchsiella alkaliacetigena]MCK8825934.1 proton-conducting membrane transporter [Fuchsiella alkaliacetigena]
MASPIWLIILPLITAFGLGIVKIFSKKLLKPFLALSATIHLILVIDVVIRAFEEPMIYSLGGWDRLFAINLVIDPLAAIMALLISVISYLVVIYSLSFIKEDKSKYRVPKYFLLLFLLIAGMLGMVLTGDLFNLYVFFEIAAITSYALVLIYKRDGSLEGTFKYLLAGTLSGVFILVAILLVYLSTGTLNMARIAVKFAEVPGQLKSIILILFLTGFGIKFALVPLHTWMPDVYPEAPAPYNAISSGVGIKASLYAFIRVIYVLFGFDFIANTELTSLLVVWGVITFMVAHLMAYQQKNLKRLFAFSSIAQVGYIIIAVSLATDKGLIAGGFHIVNHALMKGAIFLALGIFIYYFKAETIEDIKGLGRSLPLTSFTFTLAALAMIGLPPFNGFLSKWLIIEAALESGYTVAAFFIPVGSLLSLVYYLRVLQSLYSSGEPKPRVDFKRPRLSLELPAVILGFSCLLLGIFPRLPLDMLGQISHYLLDSSNYINLLLGG